MRANPLRSSAPRPRFSFLQTALLPAPTANPGRAVRFTSHFVRKIRWFRTASPGCWTVRSFYSCRSFVPVPSLPKKVDVTCPFTRSLFSKTSSSVLSRSGNFPVEITQSLCATGGICDSRRIPTRELRRPVFVLSTTPGSPTTSDSQTISHTQAVATRTMDW